MHWLDSMSYETPHGETLLTLKELAQAIAYSPSEESVNRVTRQIRHWTQSDLLKTYTGKSTGTGIPRLYLEYPTLEVAAILLELSRYGATVDILKPAADALYEEGYGDLYRSSAQTDETVFMQVSWSEDPNTGRFEDARITMFDTMDGDALQMLDRNSPSSILLNLSLVLERVYAAPRGV